MKIKLLVIRTGDIEKLAKFYELLSFAFEYYKHGDSPYHYSATVGETVIEIYPLTKSQTEADKSLRLGFEIDNFDTTIELLKENNIVFLSQPISTEFGLMAIVIDPDGRKIELYKK
ncbi:VOC family protein [Mucilaginibacter sp. AW1-7]|uniref:VOC family protein n=1 Tax=Mucilaginibacter sp. AW1-7 TaxID=3349874 RepID=UPI003F737CBF